MLKLRNVRQVFNETTIEYPDWEVPEGDHAMILGGSGSGKTTLLHILTGLLRPAQGKVWVDSLEIYEMNQGRLDKIRGKLIGMVFQKPHLVKSLNVEENIRLAGKFSSLSISDSRMEEVLSALGIGSLRNRKVNELSEGQAQRVSIARAVIHEPKLIAADEPTASLDDENTEKVISLLKNQANSCNATLVIATHDHRVKRHFENKLEL